MKRAVRSFLTLALVAAFLFSCGPRPDDSGRTESPPPETFEAGPFADLIEPPVYHHPPERWRAVHGRALEAGPENPGFFTRYECRVCHEADGSCLACHVRFGLTESEL